ncbi:hypothetical protein [Metapseudomonas resinovorans]|uniref:hypothetical protein n=1 Tax=Metapseudomonas resinovorans TaxID=53412 RepID=UPI000429993A|nr:hypothetical protein [Pseudomonas resinovorans]
MDQSNPRNYLDGEKRYFAEVGDYFEQSSGTFTEKAHAMARFMPRQSFSYMLARVEIYKRILSLHGSVLDFGIHRGASFFTWLQLNAIYEPYNHNRKFIGFDSFNGFSMLGEKDHGGEDIALKCQGGMAFSQGMAEILRGLELHDLNRPLGHVKNAFVIPGDAAEGLAQYLQEHPETIVAMANFGLGLYQPTLELLSQIKPRLQKGSVLAFEELNQANWPGETRALYEVFSPDEIRLLRDPICPHLSYLVYGD